VSQNGLNHERHDGHQIQVPNFIKIIEIENNILLCRYLGCITFGLSGISGQYFQVYMIQTLFSQMMQYIWFGLMQENRRVSDVGHWLIDK
jgi:hypothetical protein